MSTPAGPLELGQVLAGRYQVDGLIAAGGFAVVYHGTQLAQERPVAIKALHVNVTASDPAAIERFVREAAIAAHLQHPNLVQILDFGKTRDDVLYMVMEQLHGEPLHVMLYEEPMSPRRVHHLLRQILDALTFAHGQGLIHRDLKPSNVFLCKVFTSTDVDRREWVKILDFGMAKGIRKAGNIGQMMKVTLTLSGDRVGTPGYMAPEMMKDGALVTPLVDLYVAGLLGYEMLVGQKAFAGTGMARAVAQLDGDPPEPAGFIGGHPLYGIIRQLIARDPGQRFQSAEEALTALDALDTAHGQLWM
ncbi:MAG: serine/threonine-protein kinase [bacterium]